MDEYIENLRQRLLDMRDRAEAQSKIKTTARPAGRPRTRSDTPAVTNHRRRERERYWGGDPVQVWTRHAIARLRMRAKSQGLCCEVNRADLVALLDESGMTCPVFGIALRLGLGLGRGQHDDFVTIDRIDREVGFTKTNLIAMSSLAKQVMGALTDHQMTQLGDYARAVTVLRKLRTLTDKSSEPCPMGWDDDTLDDFLYRKTP